MKNFRIYMLIMVVVYTTTLIAQPVKSEKIRVAGKCDLSKIHIEHAAKSIDGVKSASWDKDSQILELQYDTIEVDIYKVHKAIAKVGHDTRLYRARQKKYEELPVGCRYERISKEEMYKKERFRWIARTGPMGIEF
jgi:copper chaperone CopZ